MGWFLSIVLWAILLCIASFTFPLMAAFAGLLALVPLVVAAALFLIYVLTLRGTQSMLRAAIWGLSLVGILAISVMGFAWLISATTSVATTSPAPRSVDDCLPSRGTVGNPDEARGHGIWRTLGGDDMR